MERTVSKRRRKKRVRENVKYGLLIILFGAFIGIVYLSGWEPTHDNDIIELVLSVSWNLMGGFLSLLTMLTGFTAVLGC